MRYSKIYYGSRHDQFPGGCRITYSAAEHRDALKTLRANGWHVHWWE